MSIRIGRQDGARTACDAKAPDPQQSPRPKNRAPSPEYHTMGWIGEFRNVMHHTIRFAEFELVPGARRLSRAGTSVRLGARAFDVLMWLVENHKRIVVRDEIIARARGGMSVGDNSLNVQVSALRKVLGAEAVVTVPGRGLRFATPVRGELPNGTAMA